MLNWKGIYKIEVCIVGLVQAIDELMENGGKMVAGIALICCDFWINFDWFWWLRMMPIDVWIVVIVLADQSLPICVIFGLILCVYLSHLWVGLMPIQG